jgi:hypothetical protein
MPIMEYVNASNDKPYEPTFIWIIQALRHQLSRFTG